MGTVTTGVVIVGDDQIQGTYTGANGISISDTGTGYNVITGAGAHAAFGNFCEATGAQSALAFGYGAKAHGQDSVAIGNNSEASALGSQSIGTNSKTSTDIYPSGNAYSEYDIAIGQAQVGGTNNIGIGSSTGDGSTLIPIKVAGQNNISLAMLTIDATGSSYWNYGQYQSILGATNAQNLFSPFGTLVAGLNNYIDNAPYSMILGGSGNTISGATNTVLVGCYNLTVTESNKFYYNGNDITTGASGTSGTDGTSGTSGEAGSSGTSGAGGSASIPGEWVDKGSAQYYPALFSSGNTLYASNSGSSIGNIYAQVYNGVQRGLMIAPYDWGLTSGQIGLASFGVGQNANPSGDFSAAFGNASNATNTSTFCHGENVTASGYESACIASNQSSAGGFGALTHGNYITDNAGSYSNAFGKGIGIETSYQSVFGTYNVKTGGTLMGDNYNPVIDPNSIFFILANGTGDTYTHNLLTANYRNEIKIDGKIIIPDIAVPGDWYALQVSGGTLSVVKQ